ncbi:hypothetical protein [Hyphomicrobium sp. D-2]|uniref:hypothetical protein n=1 Tax=Hyphomicrobium sp. D-2 TaxID=3041621 RepID=UPI00245675F9|nr:hypothetical protein [Hyphomicrobium sp. D-2]MDH4983267.1 hypothetical protein [Hyphomicrobium sp. D-2]
MKEAPIVGTPLVNAAREALGKLDSTVAGIADDLGAGSVLTAGHAVKDDAVSWINVLSKDEASKIFAPVDELMTGKTGKLNRTGVAVRSMAKLAEESGLPPPAIVKKLDRALAMNMSFAGMQNLRTQIGDMMSGNIIPEAGLSKRALKAIYAGLTEDMKFMVGKEGGAAGKRAWTEANEKFRTEIAAKREALGKIVGVDGSVTPEAVTQRLVTMAGAKRGADVTALGIAKEKASPEAWAELASSVLAHIGRDKDGFSIAKFRTEWSKLSDNGKDALYSTDHRRALDDVAKIGARFENLTKMGNPSRSGVIGLTGVGGGLAVVDPVSLISGLAAGRVLASILARPATAKVTARWANAYADYAAAPGEATFRAANRATLDMRSTLESAGIRYYPAAVTANAPRTNIATESIPAGPPVSDETGEADE